MTGTKCYILHAGIRYMATADRDCLPAMYEALSGKSAPEWIHDVVKNDMGLGVRSNMDNIDGHMLSFAAVQMNGRQEIKP